jgi:hypothetical protein
VPLFFNVQVILSFDVGSQSFKLLDEGVLFCIYKGIDVVDSSGVVYIV